LTSSNTRRARKQQQVKQKKNHQSPQQQGGNNPVLLQQQQTITRSGPLPAPEDFERYEQIHPGAAKLILDMAHSESEHRRSMEAKAMSRTHREVVIGQVFGLSIGLSALGATVMLGIYDKEVAASLVGGGTLLGLVTVFVKGRSKPAAQKK